MRIPGVSAFLAIVTTRNLNRAAAQLNLAQSTVSKRLQALEEEVGMPLIERGKGQRFIQLTPAGEAFVEIAERWDVLLQDMHSLRTNAPDLSLSVGVLDSVINSLFPEIYTELRHFSPGVRLKITTLHSGEAYEMIDRREVDVAFSLQELAHTSVNIHSTYREAMVVLRMLGEFEEKSDFSQQIHHSELDADSELYVRWGSGFQIWHDKWWDPYARGRITLDTAQLILSCFQSRNEWAIVPHSFARLAQRKGSFSVQHLAESPPERVVYLLTHRRPKISSQAGVAVFIQCLDSALNKLDGVISRCT